MADKNVDATNPSTISPRNSSNGAASEQQELELAALRYNSIGANHRIRTGSLRDTDFWQARANLSKIDLQITEKEAEIAREDWRAENKPLNSWWATEQAKKSVALTRAHMIQWKLFEEQASNVDVGSNIAKAQRRSWLGLFITSKMGLSVGELSFGKARQRAQQSRFKQALIDKYQLAGSVKGFCCDIVTGRKIFTRELTAAHLFPHSAGDDSLTAIFGSEVQGELNTPENGLLLPEPVKEALDQGLLVIVPLRPDNPTLAEIEEWEASSPKEFKFRVLDRTNQDLLSEPLLLPPDTFTVNDLDNHKISFRSEFRPRTRYLYWLYCRAVMKLSWSKKACEEAGDEDRSSQDTDLGEGVVWATRRWYLRRGLLRAFVQELGHDAGALLTNADHEEVTGEDEEGEEADPIGLFGVAEQIIMQHEAEIDDEDEDDLLEEEEEEGRCINCTCDRCILES